MTLPGRVLVTGGCGYVGGHLVRLLAAGGVEVVVYDDLSRGSESNLPTARENLRLIRGDLRDRPLLEDSLRAEEPEVVFHLAAMHFIPDCDADPVRCLSVNIQGTQNLLNAMASTGVGKALVYTSTAAVYAPDSRPHDEETSRVAPVDVYGTSKLAGEQLVQAFGSFTGVNTGIARLFNVFGPRETNPHLIPTVIRQAQIGGDIRLGNLSTSRDYVYTEDVARALLLLAEAALEGRTTLCNIGSGEAHSGDEIVSTVGAFLERELVVATESVRVRPADRPVLIAVNERAKRLLGWSPNTTFRNGLAAAIEDPVISTVAWR